MTRLKFAVSFAILFATFNGCGTTRSVESTNGIVELSASELSVPALKEKAGLDKRVRFIGRFDRIRNGSDVPELRDFNKTHYLITLTDAKGASIPLYVLVPAYNTLLPSLRKGDPIKVEGKLQTTADDEVYMLVTDLARQ